jgi:hypothetical protein
MDQGAEPLATSDATFAHAGQELYHLGAEIQGVVTCKLDAAVHGVEVRVHFLKSFQKGRICEILFRKGPKSKKRRATSRQYSSLRTNQHQPSATSQTNSMFGLRSTRCHRNDTAGHNEVEAVEQAEMAMVLDQELRWQAMDDVGHRFWLKRQWRYTNFKLQNLQKIIDASFAIVCFLLYTLCFKI